jgi:hypothetical protein
MVPPEFENLLRPGEQVIWWGRPRPPYQGSTESLCVAGGIALAVSAAAIAVAMLVGALPPAIAVVFPVFFGGYAAGVLFHYARIYRVRRLESVFAITDARLLFAHGRRRQPHDVRAIPLTETCYPNVNVTAGGHGTIVFKPYVRPFGWRWEPRLEPWAFVDVPDARAVLAIYERAAAAARAAS